MKKALFAGGTFLAGLTTGIALTEIGEYYRKCREEEAYKNDTAFSEYDQEEEEEEEQIVDPDTNITPENAYAVFLVRKDLKMRKGKIGAQCGHAALGIFKSVSQNYNKIGKYWYDNEFKKVFFYIKSQEEMNKYKKLAIQNKILYCEIVDAGRTQIEPGSHTVLSLGPVTQEFIKENFSGLDSLSK